MIKEETVRDFQDAIKTDYGVVLDDKDALEVLSNWVAYFDLLAKIDHRKGSTSKLAPM